MSALDIAKYLRPGDTILIGQAVAEPPELVAMLVQAARVIPDLTAVCGYSLSDGWRAVTLGTLGVRGFIAHGPMRQLASDGRFDVLPWHLSSMQHYLECGALRPDVVILQVGPADADGFYNLGATADYAMDAVANARVVLVEVNARMPRTRTRNRLHTSMVTAALDVDTELAGSPARPATAVEEAVARNVADLIPSGSCIQLGLGSLPDAVVRNLGDRRELQVRTGVAGDWLVDLYEAGAMASSSPSSWVSMALGTRRLYEFLDGCDVVEFASTRELVASDAVRNGAPLFAVNSAIEVDLTGQVNSEVVAGRYVGGIGGQVDFLRATRSSLGGLAIVAMAATHPSGESRIVSSLTGPVTSLRSDVDVVVTEHGVADLRGASVGERRERLAAVAAPQHRSAL
jgi:acyl-CoA hydrolase